MANNSPTIVAASLSDDQLKKSIDSLVSHVDEAMKKMVQSTNNAVGEMEAKLKSLGSLKIDSGSSNDGGTGRRTQQHEKLTKAVNDASEAVSKETQKLQDLQQSLSGASDREQNFISQKERAANTIAQENELLQRQEQELANLKSQQSSFVGTNQQTTASIDKQRESVSNLKNEVKYWQSIVSQMQSGDKKLRFNSLWLGDTTSKQGHDILDVANKLYSIMQKLGMETEKGSASTSQAVRAAEELAKYYKISREEAEKLILSVQESPLARGKYTTHYDTRFGLDNLTMQQKTIDDFALRKELAQGKLTFETDNLTLANKRLEESEKAVASASSQRSQLDSQIAAKEKEISETKGRIATATKEQSEAEKNATNAAKEKANIQSQVANQERQVAEAKKQLTTATQQHTDAETKSSRAAKEKALSFDQGQAAINTAIQSEKKYTDEIRNQAAAIRATKEWQEKGHVVVGDVNYYDKERANVSKRDKQLLLSLEEQIVQAQQKEAQEALVAAEAKRQQAQAAKEAAQASKGVSAYDLGIDPNISAGRQRQIASTRAASKETEYLKQQVASLLEVEEREIKTANTTSSSYAQLAQYLKNLQSAYQRLGADRIAKGEGTDLANEIQRTQRAMQKLQQTMSRPISLKDAMGLSEKTLDDIAYKMRQLASYRSGLNVDTQKKEIQQVNDEYNRLKKRMDEVMQKNQQMIASNTALGRSWNYMKNRLAFYFTVGASTSFIKNLIEVRSQYEMNEKALGILLDSASRGTRIFNELSQMALVSPYTLIELSNAAKQLTAYDIAAKDVVDTTRRLADMASAVGVPVERLTYALGQIKAYGYLNSRDARMFANAGIPLVKQLADRYSELEGKMVSTADVYDRMKKKAIDYNDVMAVINKMTDEGGKFFDFQAKMAETLKVRLVNLTLAWNNMLNDMGKDNQGVMTTGLKGLTVMFKHWRELYRVIATAITALGAYKVATMLVGMTTKGSIGRNAMASWMLLKRNIDAATGATAKFSVVLKSIPFTAWFTAIATLASYFILFNNSSDDVKQKLEDIKSAFDGVRKEVETLFADAIKTDNIGTQLTKLRDMLELAETELGVTIPIRLEDVNESNIKQKLKEAKQFVDEYINFSQTFSEAAAGTKFNELMNDFGSKARSTYTNVTESINSVVVALQELSEKGQASKRDIEILNELTSGQKDDESRIEYLQRLISLYEELGLIGQKKVTPKVSFFGSSEDNIEELEQQQENALDRLGIKNKSVFENMLKDVQGYYSSSSIAAYQFEQQVMRVAEKIDINNIPVEQRTMKLTAAINEEASQNNWNQFEKEFARQIANEKFGTTIEISDESKKAAEEDLQAWQRNIQNWAKNNGITFDVSFQTNDTEASYAKRMLQEAKDAKELWETLGRKEKQGTGSKDATTKAYNDYIEKRKLAAAAGADLSSLDAKSRKAASKAESELAKALKDELSTIDKVRSIYKDLTKEGMSHANAVERATRGWDETVNAINRVLQKNGLQKLNLSKFAGIENPRELVNVLQSQLNTLLKRGAKPAEIKELQTKVNTLEVDADKYDLTKITKGLNSELDRLKEEYELAVALDADPELGSIFADWMGFDMDNLPRTAQEYANRATNALNKALKKRDADLELPNLLNITDDDLRELQNRVGTGDITQTYVDEIIKAVKDVRGVFKKEKEDTSKEWNALIEKYGGLQAKLLKIYKDTVQEQASIVKQFGSDEQISQALDLVKKIQISQDPADIARLQEQLAKIINDIIKNHPIALKTYQATQKEQKSNESKAYWEEFKESDLYTMTFEDMSRNSTHAIQLIIDKLNELKFKVKEDPASMKALTKSLEDANKEFESRSSTTTVVNGIKEYIAATKEVTVAKQKLKEANTAVAGSEIALKNAQAVGDANAIADATERLQRAREKQKEAIERAAQAENKLKAAQEKIKAGLNVLASELQNIEQLLGAVASLFAEAGDEETAEAINAISKGFSVMTTVIMGVVAAMILLEASQPWLLAIAAALSVIVGLVSFLSGNENKKIDAKIKDSELAVKRLENKYKKLQAAVEDAYGTMAYAAEKAAVENKKLQLEEMKRQLRLEQSRDSKDRDDDKIESLRGQIIDLEREIQKATDNWINDMLGISSVGDAVEQLVASMIDAFRQGEDYMGKFYDSFEEMIENMIMKAIASKVIGEYIETMWNNIKSRAEARSQQESQELKNAQREYDEYKSSYDEVKAREEFLRAWYGDEYYENWIRDLEVDLKNAEARKNQALKNYEKAITPTPSDVAGMRADAEGMRGVIKEWFDATMEEWGIAFGDKSGKNLSNLQQGIQGITEDTAGALEAITNGISQQSYLQSDLLTQIRDAVVGMDIDVQTASLSQILLQLQSSYQVQMSIQGILEGWTNPSGQAVRVELVS